MLRKFLIISICVMAIIAVFGLNDRITYDGFQHAASMFDANINDFEDDIETISLLALVIDQFTSEDGFIIRHDDGAHAIIVTEVRDFVDPNTGETVRLPDPVSFYFHDTFLADRLFGLLEPISGFEEANGFFDVVINAINAVLFVLRCIISFIFLALTFIFDTVKIALQAVRAGMYLIGL